MGKKYTLENVLELNKQYPRTFIIPSEEEIQNLQPGTLVKLVFLLDELCEGCGAERMWVEIIEISGDKFAGILTNDPRYITTIEAGDIIEFARENIAAVYVKGPAPFDAKKYAIVTKRALENRQINRAFREDDLLNEEDSGWQFFYGDEDDEYMDNWENGAIVSLENVLSFEPLLEKVLIENGYDYDYSSEKNEFVRVR